MKRCPKCHGEVTFSYSHTYGYRKQDPDDSGYECECCHIAFTKSAMRLIEERHHLEETKTKRIAAKRSRDNKLAKAQTEAAKAARDRDLMVTNLLKMVMDSIKDPKSKEYKRIVELLKTQPFAAWGAALKLE